MIPIEKPVAAVDRFQRRRPWLALPVAVWKKLSDDQASNLVALFPLLLILVVVRRLWPRSLKSDDAESPPQEAGVPA